MRKLTLGIAAVAMLFAGSTSAAPDPKETAASAAAASWLALVDAGKYGDSWKEAASLFKAQLSQQQWDDALTKVRKPQGDLVSRKPKSATHKTSLPGAPDGDYFVLKFDTSYAKLPAAVETVTLMLDKDGKWRAAGFFIQ
jgi:hypothetical protein